MRNCGDCQTCCEVAEIPDTKVSWSTCQYQCASGCSVHSTDAQPPTCKSFECAWFRGIGEEGDRPDTIGAMFSVSNTPRGVIGVVIETRPNALQTTAKDMAVAFVRALRLPLVVSLYGSRPPHDTGDQVVLKREHVLKAIAMRGPFVAKLSDDVSVYELARVG